MYHHNAQNEVFNIQKHTIMNTDMKMMNVEMEMMECMSMMSDCKEMMMECMAMMRTMDQMEMNAMMKQCMEKMSTCMKMCKDMGMMQAGKNMMMECMGDMMRCMNIMMMECMTKMKMMPSSSMTMHMMAAIEMTMEKVEKMAMNMPMGKACLMMCMDMMQKIGMMMMDMEMMGMGTTMTKEMAACMDSMKCMMKMCQCCCMMCQCMCMMDGSPMPMMMGMEMAMRGMNEMQMAQMEMPGMRALMAEYGMSKPFKGMKMACSMHVTIQTAVMMKCMMAMGMEIRCCAPNMNSTQNEAAAAMNMMGIPTFGMSGMSMEDMTMGMEMCMFQDEAMTMPMDMMMDMSGMMTKMMMDKHPQVLMNMKGACMDNVMSMQMMTKMMMDNKLMMPVLNMNTSPRKAKIDYKYGSMESLVSSIRNLTGMMIAGKVCVVAGYGDMGKACADAMKMAGARVIVTEIDPFCALQACMDGCMVMKMDDACKMADIIVTATENRDVIVEKHFRMMKQNCMVCNMSDYDSEIDMHWLNSQYGSSKMTMKPMVDMYTIDGKSLFILGEGSSVNMACSMGYSSFVMSACCTIQIMAMMEFCKNCMEGSLEKKIYRMPMGLGTAAAKMHLQQLDIELDALTPAQEACLKEMEMIMPNMSMME